VIIDDIIELAEALGVDPELPPICERHLGFLYSRAAFVLSRIEGELGIGGYTDHQLGVRFKIAQKMAFARLSADATTEAF
jgi:hypothetical protein